MTKKKTWTEKLTDLQVELGYTFNKGYIDNVAVLGFAGEAGEVIAEFETPRGEYEVQAKLTAFGFSARSLDFIKKAIRNGNMPQTPITVANHGQLISELADHYYYQNALLNNLGIDRETLAEIVYKKALAKHDVHKDWKDKR